MSTLILTGKEFNMDKIIRGKMDFNPEEDFLRHKISQVQLCRSI